MQDLASQDSPKGCAFPLLQPCSHHSANGCPDTSALSHDIPRLRTEANVIAVPGQGVDARRLALPRSRRSGMVQPMSTCTPPYIRPVRYEVASVAATPGETRDTTTTETTDTTTADTRATEARPIKNRNPHFWP
jgi:hypothetical protein